MGQLACHLAAPDFALQTIQSNTDWLSPASARAATLLFGFATRRPLADIMTFRKKVTRISAPWNPLLPRKREIESEGIDN
jgi:hypothetical protein